MTANSSPDLVPARALLLGAIALGLMLRLTMGWQAPLWLDETYTAVIAGQPTASDLYGWMQRELSGPVFYSLSWLIAKGAGLSNFALRAPSLLMSFGAVLIVVWRGHEDVRLRLLWAALLALWWPGIYQASLARPQALLVMLAVVQSIAFIRIWRGGSARWSWVWSGVTALMLFTHLYAAVPGGLQGLVLVWKLRGHWRRHLLALAPFVPVAVWYFAQITFYLSFARPGVASYPVGQLRDAIDFAPDLLGGFSSLAWITLTLAGGLAIMHLRDRPSAQHWMPRLSGEAVLALCGITAALIIFSSGLIRPSYTPRYIVPCAPAVLLGIALALLRARGEMRGALKAMLLLVILQGLVVGVLSFPQHRQREIYRLEFAQGSEWLMAQRSERPVIFTWDDKVAAFNPDTNLIEVGGFFFKRAGQPRQIIVERPPTGHRGAKPLAAAMFKYQADLIWIGGANWPKALMRVKGLECRLWHPVGDIRSLACRHTDRS